jgi:hypothetical protein
MAGKVTSGRVANKEIKNTNWLNQVDHNFYGNSLRTSIKSYINFACRFGLPMNNCILGQVFDKIRMRFDEWSKKLRDAATSSNLAIHVFDALSTFY